MPNSNVEKLYNILDALEKAGKDKEEIKAIRELIDSGNLSESLERIRKLNSSESTVSTVSKKTKSNMVYDMTMLEAFSRAYKGKVEHVRRILKRPLTLAEKILYAHLYDAADVKDLFQGSMERYFFI